jgi:hypothetical protein
VRLFICFSFLLSTSFVIQSPMEFKPERIQQCESIEVNGTLSQVFPLFGPVREKEWAEGWDPEIIFSTAGSVEEHMIFRTKAHHPQEDFYTWVITQFDPQKYFIEYTVSTHNRIWFIRVYCEAKGSLTNAHICYTYTGLNDLGNQLNRESLEKMFSYKLTDWEEAINHYLKHGKLLTH